MSFEEYLVSKKIDGPAFKSAEPERWADWHALYGRVSEVSFTSQKLYLINPTRRKYLLKNQPPPAAPTDSAKPAASKPVFRPKIN